MQNLKLGVYDYNCYYDTAVFSTAALMSNIVISIMILMLELVQRSVKL